MNRTWAAAGSALFFALAPGIVAGLGPWWLTRWASTSLPFPTLRGVLGTALVIAGLALLVPAFVRFVVEGAGTPAPIAPTARLVVGGPYRYVRNPMYLGVLASILGQALVLGQSILVAYALAVGAAMALFVRWYEEPVLATRYGPEYEEYRRAVRGWWPRWSPWEPRQSTRG